MLFTNYNNFIFPHLCQLLFLTIDVEDVSKSLCENLMVMLVTKTTLPK
jgi:hypothetical protein